MGMGNGGWAIIDQMAQPDPEVIEVEPLEADLATKGRFCKWFLTIWPELNMGVLEEVLNEQCKWWVMQRERCPSTDRLHYHFACHLREGKTFAELKRILDIDSVGTAQSFKLWGGDGGIQRVIQYCSKEATRVDGPWSGGDLPNKKRRAGDVMIQMVTSGAPDADIVRAFPFQVRNLALIRDALSREVVLADRTGPPEVWFLHGEPGTGKTRFFFDMEPDHNNIIILRTPPKSGTWFFNGYRQQRITLFDDAAPPDEGNIVEWLRVLDRYPMTVDVKGGHVKFNSPVIGITTNLNWDQWVVALSPGHRIAIRRRITHVREITETTLG